ncbi:MAG: zinc ABC transporter substrate-binding protein, partial [Nitrososphaerota archaeon]
MGSHRAYGATLLLLVLLFATLIGHLSAQESGKTLVVVAGEALARVVKEVGGEYVEVKNIIPPGVDPHSYEPSAQELLSLVSGASLIVVTGPNHYPVEEKIEQLSEKGLIRARVLDYKDY